VARLGTAVSVSDSLLVDASVSCEFQAPSKTHVVSLSKHP